jgi:phenylalanyl-tRNA synthetase beta chain
MRVPYSWLAEWVDVPWQGAELGTRLTMAGFELEALEPAAPPFTHVIVAEIVEAVRHPQADKLQVCKVATGSGEPVQIVCGAANARAGLKTALAIPGAKLPGDLNIKAAKLRGVESFGMLCSAKELGLSDTSNGIIEFPADAPVGQSLREYLSLDDSIIELSVTANRGDAMSIVGVAREVAALTSKSLRERAPEGAPFGHEVGHGAHVAGAAEGSHLEAARDATSSDDAARRRIGGDSRFSPVAATIKDTFPVHLDAKAQCPKFAGRVIRGVNNKAASPVWLRERLRRCGVRSISPVVDVTNYILLELGQPMHAYDLGKLRSEIRVRLAKEGEKITLLDGRTVDAAPDVLFITDGEGPVGVAGIMGGERTSVAPETTDVFFEAAYFAPDAIRGRGRRWGLITDAGQRFERGVDPALAERAVERATALLLQIAGGQPGPVTVAQSQENLPTRAPVKLRKSQLQRLLGATIDPVRVKSTLTSLQMQVEDVADGWAVKAPTYRFDIAIEADLIEEVARIVGLDAIAESDALAPQLFSSLAEEIPAERAVLETLTSRGYYEAINYAFTDPARQSRLFPERPGLLLANAISADLSVMRVSLWPGLLNNVLLNQRRQQDRVRLFEHGTRFEAKEGSTVEIDTLAGVAAGPRLPEQWGLTKEARANVDFFDVKADVEALIAGTGAPEEFTFHAPSLVPSSAGSGTAHAGSAANNANNVAVPGAIPGLSCLHPGRAARIRRNGVDVGWIGELHPTLVREMDFTYTPVLFELDMGSLNVSRPDFEELSRFPSVRRDIALVVDEGVPLSALRERVVLAASSLLRTFRVFDVYRGPGVESGRKSVALGLIFQDITRTLTDEDADRAVASVVAELRVSLNAKIRE